MNGIGSRKIVPEYVVHIQPFQIEVVLMIAPHFSDVCCNRNTQVVVLDSGMIKGF